MDKNQFTSEIKEHLLKDIIPFWMKLKDSENGGFYGLMDYELNVDKTAEKGCILNSRILWFFSNAYLLVKEAYVSNEELAQYGYEAADIKNMADHAYDFMTKFCLDKVNGGIFWSMDCAGAPLDTTKHTYNQAFAIYALSSYYDATGNEEALKNAFELKNIIEGKCRDKDGYLEAFTIDFAPESNEKLSENGVMAGRTMNTLLHVFEAYSELYRVTKDADTADRLREMMDIFAEKIYNPKLARQEVFFDMNYNSIIDLYSYGHDIETSWLIDRGATILGDKNYLESIFAITKDLANSIYKVAFDGHSLANECDKGAVNDLRIWWVQAETVLGFLNAYDKTGESRYLEAAYNEWEYIRDYQIDKRCGEWFREVQADREPLADSPLVEPWKCPYHNGRMCIEVIKRGK